MFVAVYVSSVQGCDVVTRSRRIVGAMRRRSEAFVFAPPMDLPHHFQTQSIILFFEGQVMPNAVNQSMFHMLSHERIWIDITSICQMAQMMVNLGCLMIQ